MSAQLNLDCTDELSDISSFDGPTSLSEDAVECENVGYEKCGGTCSNSVPIFTVGHRTSGYSLSPLERRRISSVMKTCCPEDRAIPVKYLFHDLTLRGLLRQFFIRNPTSRLACTFFDLGLKFIICLIYVVRVFCDDVSQYECDGSRCEHDTGSPRNETDGSINWYVLLWVQRSLTIWMSEMVLSVISLAKFLLKIYADTKGNRMNQVCSSRFLLEMICSVPLFATLVCPDKLKDLFVPVFLNCWLVKHSLVNIYNDLHLTRRKFQTISVTLLQQMVLLVVSIVCLVFTNVCVMQHLQRASQGNKLTMFESVYFVVVTFSTVGYGDISPDIWIGQIFMILMICVALASIPRQIEGLVSTYMERQRAGGEYSWRAAHHSKHVIVCSSTLTQDTLMDFLSEFYAHPKLEDHTVILLCPQDLDSSKQVILKDPKWTQRVIYMKGSSLKDQDLKRCRVQQADACFFPAPRPTQDKIHADRHTILRSWAVKDFAPMCKQYIHLFHAANRIHVNFAEHVVCEDEFKYALLASNCLYPGLSTLVSLLVHTSTGQEGKIAPEPWQQVFGRHSGNEIYHIQLQKSVFFRKYDGESFPSASADAHSRFGVALLAVLDSQAESPRLQLNPGPEYRLKGQDFCFYMSVTREENSWISPEAMKSVERCQDEDVAVVNTWYQRLLRWGYSLYFEYSALQKYHVEPQLIQDQDETVTSLMGNNVASLAHRFTAAVNYNPSGGVSESGTQDSLLQGSNGHRCSVPLVKVVVEDCCDSETDSDEIGDDEVEDTENIEYRHGSGCVFQFYDDMGQEKLITGPPPVTICSGSSRTHCHIMSERRQHCCLVWGTHCEHCTYKNASDERWGYQLIILAAEHAAPGIFNFIVPLRSSFIGVNGLIPIVLLLEEEPDSLFLDTIALFPLVYYITGSIRRVDDLLLAGINKASHLVVVNRDSVCDYGEEEILADSETVVAVQTIFKLFPNTYVVTELSQASNMRFMHFSAQDAYSQEASRLEQKLKDVMTTNLSHMFRLPFAGGQVFSASMLDTLLYQTFVKGYLISFVRLLLGIDAEKGSGHLSSIRIKEATAQKFPEYGQLYEALCSSTGEIPFAIYRTEKIATSKNVGGDRETCLEEMAPVNSAQADEYRTGKLCEPKTEIVQPRKTRPKTHSTISQRCFSQISKTDQGDMSNLIYDRLQALGLDEAGYSCLSERAHTFSCVITNPSPRQKLQAGDIVYVIQPSSMCAKPSKHSSYLHPSSCNLPRTLSRTPSQSTRSASSAPRDRPQKHRSQNIFEPTKAHRYSSSYYKNSSQEQ